MDTLKDKEVLEHLQGSMPWRLSGAVSAIPPSDRSTV